MSQDIFVIVKMGWEYNDEYYVSDGGGYGSPKKAYTTKELAKEDLESLTIKEAKGLNLRDYEFNGDDKDYAKIIKFYRSLLTPEEAEAVDDWDEYWGDLVIKDYFNNKDILKLLWEYDITLFKIVPIKLD